MIYQNGQQGQRSPKPGRANHQSTMPDAGDGDADSLTAALKDYLFAAAVDDKKTPAQAIVEELGKQAKEGNLKAIQEIRAWIDGEAKSRAAVATGQAGTGEYPVDVRKAQKILDIIDDHPDGCPRN
jgi:hypothetical protein